MTFDELNIIENKALQTATMKIDEPDTPYRYEGALSEDEDEDMTMDDLTALHTKLNAAAAGGDAPRVMMMEESSDEDELEEELDDEGMSVNSSSVQNLERVGESWRRELEREFEGVGESRREREREREKLACSCTLAIP